MKRGQGGRGRGSKRKNALPISSGEALAKERGRQHTRNERNCSQNTYRKAEFLTRI